MRLRIEAELFYTINGTADVLLQIEAAAMADQRLLSSDLRVSAGGRLVAVPGEDGIGQRTWAPAATLLQVDYAADVEITRDPADLSLLPAAAPSSLPVETIPYLLPSRYCPVDPFHNFVHVEFAGLRGGALAQALADWVHDHLSYGGDDAPGVATAADTFVARQGVCRDYAHLLVSLARAVDLPARCVSAYAPGVDPPDFHAVAEIWLGDRWHLVDATGMAGCGDIARVVVGRDATDIAFMTTFGTATMNRQQVRVSLI